MQEMRRTREGIGGMTVDREKKIAEIRLSIHAPAWGATPAGEAEGTSGTLSIHAPAWGATVPEPFVFC